MSLRNQLFVLIWSVFIRIIIGDYSYNLVDMRIKFLFIAVVFSWWMILSVIISGFFLFWLNGNGKSGGFCWNDVIFVISRLRMFTIDLQGHKLTFWMELAFHLRRKGKCFICKKNIYIENEFLLKISFSQELLLGMLGVLLADQM